MRFFKSIISSIVLVSLSGVAAQDEYVRGQDPQADAIRDMQTGMAGLQQAAKDPVLMAQLMQDLQVRFGYILRHNHIKWKLIIIYFNSNVLSTTNVLPY